MKSVKKTSRPSNLLSIKESQARRERPMTGFGLWRLGFRPFYLGAALFSSSAILLWLGLLSGVFSLPETSINAVSWHAHEMVFGFAFAIIAGFLLTASNNWTGILPAAGLPLAMIFTTWLLARLFIILGNIWLAAALDITFSVLLIGALFRVFWQSKHWKNLPILGLVVLMSSCNAWFYIRATSNETTNLLYPVEITLFVILQLLVVMGGRIIPNFTQNGVQGIKVWKPSIFIIATPTSTALAVIAWFVLPPRLAFVLCVIAAGINLVRWLGWKPWLTLKHPMVWVLQLGYLWIPIALVLMGLEALGIVSRSLPIHALAVGGMGLIIAGMITRTAMGHTGRQIVASRFEYTFFVLVAISAVLRVSASMPIHLTPYHNNWLLLCSGMLWSLGFLTFLYRYTPWLSRPRIDGNPG